LEKFSREFKKQGLELSDGAKERLLGYRWPGNVRELQNTMERAVILTDGLSITAEGLQLPATKPDTDSLPAGMLPEAFSWEGTLEEVAGRAAGHVERVLLESTLRECKWNKTKASEKLGVSPKTLLAKLRSAGLEE
jgi:DNA-binding NtrC family response regulator